jgi:hypothetical protein
MTLACSHTLARVLVLRRTCDACVGHVCVNPTTSVPAGSCPSPSRDGLIVAHARVTKREVVHAALHATAAQSSVHNDPLSACSSWAERQRSQA